MAQIKVKQVNNLQSTLNALTGINTIVETFTTTSINGDTGITITNSAREADAILVYVNGHKIQEGYSWKKDGSAVTADSLEAGTELVWDASVAGYTLDGVADTRIPTKVGHADLKQLHAWREEDWTIIDGQIML